MPRISKEFLLAFAILIISTGFFLKDLKNISATYDENFSYVRNSKYLVKNFKWDQPYIKLHPPLMYYIHGWPFIFYESQKFETNLYLSRIATLPLFIAFGFFLFLVSKRTNNTNAAFLTLILYSFSTEVLAHARLTTADFLLATTTTLSLVSFYYFIKNQSYKAAGLAGLMLGIALISKYSALLLIPLYCLIFFCFENKSRGIFSKSLRLLLTILIAFLIIHTSYLFKESAKLPNGIQQPILIKILENQYTRRLLFIFPRAYTEGLDMQFSVSQGVWWGYFANKQYYNGLWYFYPVAFLLKTQIPLLIIMFWYFLVVFKERIIKDIEKVFLITICFFFLYFCLLNKLIIGLRYLLMVYPLLFLLVAAVPAHIGFKKMKISAVVILVLITTYIFQAATIAPHYLAYTNEFIGGPKKAYKYFADSNLDWDQNTILFQNYLKNHPEITVINPRKPVAGVFAVNVNEMNLYYYNEYNWLRVINKEPIDQVGYTWLIFSIKPEEL